MLGGRVQIFLTHSQVFCLVFDLPELRLTTKKSVEVGVGVVPVSSFGAPSRELGSGRVLRRAGELLKRIWCSFGVCVYLFFMLLFFWLLLNICLLFSPLGFGGNRFHYWTYTFSFFPGEKAFGSKSLARCYLTPECQPSCEARRWSTRTSMPQRMPAPQRLDFQPKSRPSS